MKQFLLFIVFIIITQTSFGNNKEEKKFKLTGKPILTIFANYHVGLGRANKESGFSLDRSYLGYQANITEHLSGKVVFDIGSTKVEGADIERVAYVKNAMLSWQTGNLTVDFGLIGLEQFNMQEKFWGYRYIQKSFQDKYQFGSSADMGVLGKYKFTRWFSADLTFINGEGYKKLNTDNKYRYGLGISILPTSRLSIRAYYDIQDKNSQEGSKSQQTLALFAGYKFDRLSIGAEYNKQYNTDFVKEHDQEGFSIYSTIKLGSQFQVFGRYDNLISQNQWSDNDTQYMLFGIQYSPIKQLKISPNFQNNNPYSNKSESLIYLNIEFKI